MALMDPSRTGSSVRGSDGNLYGVAGQGGSNVVGVFFQLIVPPVAIPVFSPAAGTYARAQTVTISSATGGRLDPLHDRRQHAKRNPRHTLLRSGQHWRHDDDSMQSPTRPDSPTSPVAAAPPPTPSTSRERYKEVPTFSPGGGIYTSAQSVSITSATSGGDNQLYNRETAASRPKPMARHTRGRFQSAPPPPSAPHCFCQWFQ